MIPIGEVARRASVPASTIRYYERVGLLPAPERQAGQRRYTEEVLLRLQVIRFARENAFTLGEIGRLLSGRPYSDRLRQLASAKIAELERVAHRARSMQAILRTALRCRCTTLEACGRRMAQAETRRRAP